MADDLSHETSIRVTVPSIRLFIPSPVRVRPFNSTELELFQNGFSAPRPAYASQVTANQAIRKIVHVLDDNVVVFDPPPSNDDGNVAMNRYRRALMDNTNVPVQAYRRYKDVKYAFDRVFNEDATQMDVYERTTRDLIAGILNGYNATVFAYGDEKHHLLTIFYVIPFRSGTVDDPGIIFLTVRELFDRIEVLQEDKTIQFSLSYLEVYNEMIRDLLVDKDKGLKQLAIREDVNNRIVVASLSEHHPKTVDEVMNLILRGNANRTMSPTEANAVSSRSHAVLQINVRQRPRTADIHTDYTLATLSLIDLAGSERAAATKNRGDRMLEGANINRSLLALGNCINALCDISKKEQHIPYRDSKLTRLLKFSLGGNCKTVMIVCVSPSSLHYEETHNTLKYANRAKNIKTKVQRNLLSVDRHVTQYVQAIHQLRQEITDLKSKISDMEENGYQTKGAQGKREAASKSAEEAIKKMRASYEITTAKDVEVAQAQARMTMIQMKLDALRGWQESFDGNVAKLVDERMRQQTHGYKSMVDNLIRELEAQTQAMWEKMENAKKIAGSRKIDISGAARDNELVKKEKEILELRSENARLKSEMGVQTRVVEEQWELMKGFLRLNGACLAGLRNTIADVEAMHIEQMEEGGQCTDYLNSLYMQNITLFTDSTKRSIVAFDDNVGPGAGGHLLFGKLANGFRTNEGRGIAPFSRSASTSAKPNRIMKDADSNQSNIENTRPKRRVSMAPTTTTRPAGVSDPPRRRSLYQPNPSTRLQNVDPNGHSPPSRHFRIRTPRKTILLVSRLSKPTKSSMLKTVKEEPEDKAVEEMDSVVIPSVPRKRFMTDAADLGVNRSAMVLRSRAGPDISVSENYDSDSRNLELEDRPTRPKRSRRAVTFADEPVIFGEAVECAATSGISNSGRRGGLKKVKEEISPSLSSCVEDPPVLSATPPEDSSAGSDMPPAASRDRSGISAIGPIRISGGRRMSRRHSLIPPPPPDGGHRSPRRVPSTKLINDEDVSPSKHNTNSPSLAEESFRRREPSARPRRQTIGAEDIIRKGLKSFGGWDSQRSFGGLGPATRSKKIEGSGLKITKVPDLVGGLLGENLLGGKTNLDGIDGSIGAGGKENSKPKWK
ncbi:hypothetical protein BC936DRAFT_143692 [Jimgerdemannia flammicorona]|uniref:Kinesin motor domain-containing protein n=1 Tax=Jimgerdemannia flammicorona TaxID=994334 RepID=A0A433DNZ0_9FUNG|nr:hypothetical protein BC936DRAFT_143692 [Jimgerdemannia flammicorona]